MLNSRNFSISKHIFEPLLAFALYAVVISLMYFSLDKGYGLYAIAAFLGIGIFFVFVKFPRVWLYTVMLSSFAFFHGSSEGITPIDVATALLYNGFVYTWIFWEVLINKKRIVRGYKDWLLIVFYCLLILNGAIAIAIGTSFSSWIAEFILSSTILLYFPVRKYFTKKKHLKMLLIVFGISASLAALYHLNIYRESIIEKSLYVFQLGGSLKVNQALYTISAAVGIIFLLYAKNIFSRFILIAFTGLSFISLLSTFSRTFWLLLMLLVVILFYYLEAKRLKLVIYGFIVASFFILSVFIVFPNNADFVFGFFENRLTSAGKTVKDVSVQARLDEWDLVFERIERYPLGGSGLNKKIKFYSMLSGYSWHTSNIHNGYFALTHKVGIPMALMYFLVYFIFLIKSEMYIRKLKDPFYKILALISFITLLMLTIGAITSNQFMYRDNIFQILLSFAFVGIIESLIIKKYTNGRIVYEIESQ